MSGLLRCLESLITVNLCLPKSFLDLFVIWHKSDFIEFLKYKSINLNPKSNLMLTNLIDLEDLFI